MRRQLTQQEAAAVAAVVGTWDHPAGDCWDQVTVRADGSVVFRDARDGHLSFAGFHTFGMGLGWFERLAVWVREGVCVPGGE